MSNHFATNHVIIFFFILSLLLVHDHDFFPSKPTKPITRDSSSSICNCPTTTNPAAAADPVLVFLSGVFFAVLLIVVVRFPANLAAPFRSGVDILRRIKRRRPQPPPPPPIDGESSIGGGISGSMLKSLPIFVFCPVNRPKLGKGTGECAICLSEFLDEQTLRWLPECDHLFHRNCIDAWFESHKSCPCCRANVERIAGDILLRPIGADSNSNSVGPELRSSLMRFSGGDGGRDLDGGGRIGCGGGFIGGLVRVLMGRRRHRIQHR